MRLSSNKLRVILVTISLTLVMLIVSNAIGLGLNCAQVLSTPRNYPSIQQGLKEMLSNREHFDEFIRQNEITSSQMDRIEPLKKENLNLEQLKWLSGAQSKVVIVNLNGVSYILKILKGFGDWPHPESATQYNRDPLVIQKTLGDRGYAPKLLKIVPRSILLNWMKNNLKALEPFGIPYISRFEYGILMELAQLPSLKSGQTGFRELKDEERAQQLRQQLVQLGIKAQDIDYIYGTDGRLMLIDFEYYSLNP